MTTIAQTTTGNYQNYGAIVVPACAVFAPKDFSIPEHVFWKSQKGDDLLATLSGLSWKATGKFDSKREAQFIRLSDGLPAFSMKMSIIEKIDDELDQNSAQINRWLMASMWVMGCIRTNPEFVSDLEKHPDYGYGMLPEELDKAKDAVSDLLFMSPRALHTRTNFAIVEPYVELYEEFIKYMVDGGQGEEVKARRKALINQFDIFSHDKNLPVPFGCKVQVARSQAARFTAIPNLVTMFPLDEIESVPAYKDDNTPGAEIHPKAVELIEWARGANTEKIQDIAF